MKHFAKAGTVALALSGSIVLAIASASYFFKKQDNDSHQVVYRSGTDVPDPGKVGTPDKTVERGRELVALLRQSNWKISKGFPFEKLTVEDQRYAEFPQDRVRQTSFGIPKSQPPYEEIAVICDTYVRKNITAQRGGTSSQAPSGFFIVGFKDGRVEKIPVAQVRVKEYPVVGASKRRIGLLFPGTKEYDPKLPRF